MLREVIYCTVKGNEIILYCIYWIYILYHKIVITIKWMHLNYNKWKVIIVLFVETPRKFITAKLSIRKPGSSSVLIICDLFNSRALLTSEKLHSQFPLTILLLHMVQRCGDYTVITYGTEVWWLYCYYIWYRGVVTILLLHMVQRCGDYTVITYGTEVWWLYCYYIWYRGVVTILLLHMVQRCGDYTVITYGTEVWQEWLVLFCIEFTFL